MAASRVTQLLTKAAGEVLGPLGLRKLGARKWVDDRGWWLYVVDFEASGTKGSGLAVSADFLWRRRDGDGLAWAYGGRVTDGPLLQRYAPGIPVWADYEDDGQFGLAARAIVDRAAHEVEQLRASHSSLADWVPEFERLAASEVGWAAFDAAIGNGLLGEIEKARSWLDAVLHYFSDEEFEWERQARAHAQELLDLIDEGEAAFARTVRNDVNQFRQFLRLPEINAPPLAE